MIRKATDDTSRGGATNWLPLGIFVGMAVFALLATLSFDQTQFPELEGDWTVTSANVPPELRLPKKVRLDANGLIRNVGLVGKGLCGRDCYTLHLLQTGKTYPLRANADGRTLTVTELNRHLPSC